jgi:cytochrome c
MCRSRATRCALRVLALGMAVALSACDEPDPVHLRVVGGDHEEGRRLVRAYGCTACHVIPGVHDARGQVGPSLAEFAKRSFIAGEHPNRPDLLVQWLRHPPLMAPRTAMPDMGVSHDQARHIAAYLYTLR